MSHESTNIQISELANSNLNKNSTINKNLAQLHKNSLIDNAANVYEVTRKGLINSLPSINDIPKDIENLPKEIFNKKTLTEFGTSAATGLIMKAVIPESGIVPVAIGGYFMINFALDGLKPMVKGWTKAWNATDNKQIDDAAKGIGKGIDQFVGNSAIGLAGFGLGAKAFDFGGKAIFGSRSMSDFYNAKDQFWTSKDTTIGSKVNAISDKISSKLKTVGQSYIKSNADYAQGISDVTSSNIPLEDKLTAIKQMVKHYAIDQQHEAYYMLGAIGKDGVPHGFDRTLDLISQGLDPTQLDGKDRIISQTRIDDETSKTSIDKIRDAQRSGLFSSEGKAFKQRQQFDPQTIADMAQAARKSMMDWSGEKQVIADVTDPQLASVSQGLYPAEAMDPGYRQILPELASLRNQITSIEDLRVVQPIMDGVSRAVSQRGAYFLDQTSQDVWSLNKFGQQIYEGLKDGMIKKGKLSKAEVDQILTMKNPSLFLVRSDGSDPIHGQPGQGPYTVPGIKGVISLDTVYVPRNMSDLNSVMANGIYGHELGHDQYGGILEFPQNIREEVIQNTIKKAIGETEYNREINVPGHGKMAQGKLIEEIFKAQANENTADMWGAAWTGKNAGFSLGMLLQALRDSGQLESRSVYGQPIASDENPMGIEVHAIDKLRPLMIAQAMRILGKGDGLLNSQADALENYAKASSKPGDYTWYMLKPREPQEMQETDTASSNDQAGKNSPKAPKEPPPSFSINEDLMNKAAKAIVEAQLNTPLTALKGRTFSDILPDLASQVHRMNDLGKAMAEAIAKKQPPEAIKFDTNKYTMNDVLGSGMDAATLLVSGGMDPIEANAKVNEYSSFLRNLYHKANPNDPVLSWKNPTMSNGIVDVLKEKAIGQPLYKLGNYIEQNKLQNNLKVSKLNQALPLTAGTSISTLTGNILEHQEIKKQIIK